MSQSHISTYPVGLWADIKRRRKVKSVLSYLRYHAERRNWRAVRNYFSGAYLAEWHYPPAGMRHHRCGKGWTRRGALRSLGKHIIDSNVGGAE